MTSALIGYTGFVGGNLASQHGFDDLYNSSNIAAIAGRSYDLVVCAGTPAVKYLANQRPAEDRAAIARLTQALESVSSAHFVLISTVDVHPDPVDVDERSPIDEARLQPYGRHRLELERFVAARFPTHTIVRLPALFGPGLKKNVIYDFLHENCLDLVHQGGVFQFYPLTRLWPDIAATLRAKLATVHFAVEPIAVRELAEILLERPFTNSLPAPAPRYDLRTIHAPHFGATGPYIYQRADILAEIEAFARAVRRARP